MKKALILASTPSMIEQFNMNNIKILQDLGYIVEVAANFENGGTIDEKRLESFKEELKNDNINFINIPFSRSPFSRQNFKAYKETKKIMKENNYDLIHLHSPIGGVCGRLAARKQKAKVIYTAHGFHFYKGAPLLNWLIYYPIEKWLSKYTDVLITINQEDYKIAKEKFKAKDVKLVHGVGVETEKFNFEMSEEEKHNLRKNLGLKDEDFVLICIGELNKNKNQIMAIEAMKELVKEKKNIKLLLVGRGEKEEFYKLKISEYNLENNVKLLGYRRDIPQLLKISNCALALSIREGLGLNVLEAISSKIPIITTKNRGHKELIQDEILMIENNEKNELIKKIIYVMKNNILTEFINKNYENMEKFSIQNIQSVMKEIYERINI